MPWIRKCRKCGAEESQRDGGLDKLCDNICICDACGTPCGDEDRTVIRISGFLASPSSYPVKEVSVERWYHYKCIPVELLAIIVGKDA